MSTGTEPGRLRPSLRAGGVLMLTLAALSPAASVYVTGAAILHFVGTGAVAAVIAGGGVVMIATMLYAELGAAFPHAGGVYHGIGEVLGRRWGSVAMALGVATAPALLAFVALGLATYVRTIVPGAPPLVIADGAIAAAVLVGLLSIRSGLWVTGALLVVELSVLAVLIALGWWHPAKGFDTVLLHPLTLGPQGTLVAPGSVALVLASIAGAYACLGSSLAINFAEEVDDPSRVVGRVVLWGGGVSVLLVILAMVAIAVGAPDLARTLAAEAPIADALQVMVGPSVAGAMAIIVALAIFDHIASALIAYSRLIFAAARSTAGQVRWLTVFTRVQTRSGVPAMAVVALGTAAMLLTLVGERGLLLLVSGELVTPALMIVAVLLGRRRGQTGRTTFRSPFYPALPFLGLAVLAVFLTADLFNPAARISVLLAVGVAVIVAYLGGAMRGSATGRGTSTRCS